MMYIGEKGMKINPRAMQVEQLRREEIHRILDLVLDINGLGERTKEKTGDMPTAFFDFNGNSGSLRAVIYAKGWTIEGEPDFSFEIDTYSDRFLHNPTLFDAADELEQIKYELHL